MVATLTLWRGRLLLCTTEPEKTVARLLQGELLNPATGGELASNHDVGRFLYFMPTTDSGTKAETLHLASLIL